MNEIEILLERIAESSGMKFEYEQDGVVYYLRSPISEGRA
jgi:hypothetical protein